MQSCYIALWIYTSLLCIQVYDCALCLEWCRASQLKGKVDRSKRSRCWAQTWGLHLNTVFELLIPIKIAFIIYVYTKSCVPKTLVKDNIYANSSFTGWNILSKCKLSKVRYEVCYIISKQDEISFFREVNLCGSQRYKSYKSDEILYRLIAGHCI